jgi:hypothetical protein
VAIAVSAGNSMTFTPCPQGVHQAVCVDVVDMGLLEVTWNGQVKKQHKVRIVWQVEELMDDGKPFIVQKRYTASLHEKSKLRPELESWRGRAFTEDELREFDLEKLIGANCLLNVAHVSKDGKTYANVTAVMPLKKGMEKLTPRDYTRVVDRTTTQQADPEHDEPPPITDDDIPF